MGTIKPKIFFGSSTSGAKIAEKVKSFFEPHADCVFWNDSGVWEPNRSTFDNLIRMAGYFDFGVFVATSDDLTLTNDQIVIEPRDNVILEMALFLGALGRDKSFLFVEKGIKLPSDFNGIYMPRFNPKDENSIKSACDEYITKMKEHYELGHLSLYPTTALAIGYYKNFLSSIVQSIHDAQELEYDGTVFSDFKFKVVIPKDLKGIIREKAALFYKRHGFVENSLQTKFRKHPAWFQLDVKNAPHATMYDMPSTLTGIDDAIELVMEKNYAGRTKLQEIIEQRELNNFRKVLQLLINNSPFAKEIIEIVDEY